MTDLEQYRHKKTGWIAIQDEKDWGNNIREYNLCKNGKDKNVGFIPKELIENSDDREHLNHTTPCEHKYMNNPEMTCMKCGKVPEPKVKASDKKIEWILEADYKPKYRNEELFLIKKKLNEVITFINNM